MGGIAKGGSYASRATGCKDPPTTCWRFPLRRNPSLLPGAGSPLRSQNRVVSLAREELVRSTISIEQIVPATTIELVIPRLSQELIVPCAAVHLIGAGTAVQAVLATAAGHSIRARAAVEAVGSDAGVEEVVPGV